MGVGIHSSAGTTLQVYAAGQGRTTRIRESMRSNVYFKMNHSTAFPIERRHTSTPEKSSGTKTLL